MVLTRLPFTITGRRLAAGFAARVRAGARARAAKCGLQLVNMTLAAGELSARLPGVIIDIFLMVNAAFRPAVGGRAAFLCARIITYEIEDGEAWSSGSGPAA
jgi:hypothetical protein